LKLLLIRDSSEGFYAVSSNAQSSKEWLAHFISFLLPYQFSGRPGPQQHTHFYFKRHYYFRKKSW